MLSRVQLYASSSPPRFPRPPLSFPPSFLPSFPLSFSLSFFSFASQNFSFASFTPADATRGWFTVVQPIIFEIGRKEAAKCEIARKSSSSSSSSKPAIWRVKRVATKKGATAEEEEKENEREKKEIRGRRDSRLFSRRAEKISFSPSCSSFLGGEMSKYWQKFERKPRAMYSDLAGLSRMHST